MSKCLDNSLLVFSILLFNNVFLGMDSIATPTNSNDSTQIPQQYQQQYRVNQCHVGQTTRQR